MYTSRSIVLLNLTLSLAFGIAVGIIFPFYVQLFGIRYANSFQFFIFFFSCILAGAVVGLLSFLINKITIVRIVKLIAQELKVMAEGQGDLTRTLEIHSNDELGQLALWFNAFVRRLDTMVGSTKRLARTMRDNGVEFNINLRHAGEILQTVSGNLGVIYKLSDSQIKIMRNAEQQLQQFTQQISQVAEDSGSLVDSFKDFTHYVQKQAGQSQDFFNRLDGLKYSLGDQNSGKTSSAGPVKQGESNSDLLGVTTQFAKESTRSLDEQVQRFTRIEKLLEEIEDIAESTHLLSINASIEAARAGESGRGFTIVALQIRNLATNSGTLTSEIREQMEAIMNMAKNSGTQLTDLRTVLNNHMENVITDVQQLTSSARDISKTVEIISTMQLKLKERIADIDNGFTEVKMRREGLLNPITELGTCTEKLRESVQRISTGSSDVEKVTEKFLFLGAETEKQAQDLVRSTQDYQTSQDKARNDTRSFPAGPTAPATDVMVAESDLGGVSGGETFA